MITSSLRELHTEQGLILGEIVIPVTGGQIKALTYIPDTGGDETYPVMLWMHGL